MGRKHKNIEPTVRELSVIESAPCSTESFVKYAVLSAQEREQIRQIYPGVNVRLANQQEARKLQAEENPWE